MTLQYSKMSAGNSVLVCHHTCLSTTDPVAGPWTLHSTTVRKRFRHSGAVAGDRLYLLAGWHEEAAQTTEWIAAGSTEWTLGPDIPHSVGYGSCSVSPSPTAVIITGGARSPGKAARLDVTTDVWTDLPDLPRPRHYHGCAVVDRGEKNKKYLVVAGGWGRKV